MLATSTHMGTRELGLPHSRRWGYVWPGSWTREVHGDSEGQEGSTAGHVQGRAGEAASGQPRDGLILVQSP